MDDADGWALWIRHLVNRTQPQPFSEILPCRKPPLLWAADDPAQRDLATLLRGHEKAIRSPRASKDLTAMAAAWLASTEASRVAGDGLADGPYCALQSLAWCHALPKLAGRLDAARWWRMLDRLLDLASDAPAAATTDAPAEIHPPADASAEAIGNPSAVIAEQPANPLVRQLLAGELALTLAYLFPELTPCRKLETSARRTLSQGLCDLLDGEGLPHGDHMAILRPLQACWTRCRALGNALPGGCWTSAAQTQFAWLVRQALRLTRADGSHAFSHGGGACGELFQTALQLGGDDEDRRIAAALGPAKGKRSSRGRKAPLPEPALHSEWAATAVLRSSWLPSMPWLAAIYSQPQIQLEIHSGRDCLGSGPWTTEIQRDGVPLEPVSPWEEVCWVCDEDVAYLEIEAELTGGHRIQRHLLLAKQDGFVLLADSLLSKAPAAWEYTSRLPLCQGVAWDADKESRDGFLVARGKRRALAMPIAQPEWRSDPRGGHLKAMDQTLELHESGHGFCLFTPLWIDLHAARIGRPLTWRQLTVAESLRVQPSDRAVGYRVMVGAKQWLVYRSLVRTANRTLLGHNLSSQMLVARFGRDGEVDPLIEIE
jgi:hypothetical protein